MKAHLPILFLAACGPEPTARAVFDAAVHDLVARYGPAEQRGVDWASEARGRRDDLPDAVDDDALWEALTDLLAVSDDGHVQLYAPDRPHFFANHVYRERRGDDRFDPEAIDAALRERHLAAGGTVTHGWYQEARYVRLTVVGPGAHELPLARADAEAQGTGLIVDLRHNWGGDFTFARAALASFTDREIPVFRSRTRNGPDPQDFDPWTTWSIPAGGVPPEVPVVVLTDRFTISAGERTSWMLRSLPGVVHLGEPTNGALATMIGRELPNGWYLTLPVQEVEGVDGAVYEGPGIPPHLPVFDDPATPTDEALDQALAVIRAR